MSLGLLNMKEFKIMKDYYFRIICYNKFLFYFQLESYFICVLFVS